MSHELELLTLIEEYAALQSRAGALRSKIEHHVTMIAVLRDVPPRVVLRPETPETSETPAVRPLSSVILTLIKDLGGEIDSSTLRRHLTNQKYPVKYLARTMMELRKQGKVAPSTTHGIYRLPSNGDVPAVDSPDVLE